MVFIAQVLLSAVCISPANAGSMNMPASKAVHCHSESMASNTGSMNTQMSACSHCDVPDMGLSALNSTHIDMTSVFLAIIILPEMPTLASLGHATSINQGAPPPRANLLHHRNQRILI